MNVAERAICIIAKDVRKSTAATAVYVLIRHPKSGRECYGGDFCDVTHEFIGSDGAVHHPDECCQLRTDDRRQPLLAQWLTKIQERDFECFDSGTNLVLQAESGRLLAEIRAIHGTDSGAVVLRNPPNRPDQIEARDAASALSELICLIVSGEIQLRWFDYDLFN